MNKDQVWKQSTMYCQTLCLYSLFKFLQLTDCTATYKYYLKIAIFKNI